MSSKPTVVIIGGSYAGIGVAKSLLKTLSSVKVILINPSEKFFFNIAAPRILARPDAFDPDRYLLSIKDLFAKNTSGAFEFVQGHACALDLGAKAVSVRSDDATKSIHYDFLVVASGSTTASTIGKDSTKVPFKATQTAADVASIIRAAQEEIAGAKSILVIGGGPVGVEFAGELGEARKGLSDSQVILVTQSERLLPTLKLAASEKARVLLEKQGVKIHIGRQVVDIRQDQEAKEWTVTLDTGDKITADLSVSTTGLLPNNSFLPQGLLSADGWVKVNAEFQVLGDSNQIIDSLYAVGDITTHALRLASKVQEQVPVVAANIKADILGSGARARYTPKDSVMMMVPIGSSGGTGQMSTWVPWSCLVSLLKGRDYLISYALSFLGGK
jgi:NADH dehydrogenase FAD-containing subunit